MHTHTRKHTHTHTYIHTHTHTQFVAVNESEIKIVFIDLLVTVKYLVYGIVKNYHLMIQTQNTVWKIYKKKKKSF